MHVEIFKTFPCVYVDYVEERESSKSSSGKATTTAYDTPEMEVRARGSVRRRQKHLLRKSLNIIFDLTLD